jgi:N-acetylglutamate synthase-like GNAT family acetyltransferase
MAESGLQIREAKKTDLFGVMYLIRECVRDMNNRGLFHWNTSYPNYDIMNGDIEKKSLFIVREKGFSVAFFTLSNEQMEEYKNVDWSSDNSKSIIINRIAIHPKWQGADIDKSILEFVENKAKDDGYETIRCDFSKEDSYFMPLFKDNDYEEKGEIKLSYQDAPFSCLEKKIDKK